MTCAVMLLLWCGLWLDVMVGSLRLEMVVSGIHLVVQHSELVSSSLVLSGASALTASHSILFGTVFASLMVSLLVSRLVPYCRSQHIFIDPSKPRSAYGMSYNCVNFSGNQRSFNDGYHTIHHLNSKLHWTQLPQHFIQAAEQGAISGVLTSDSM